MSKKYRTTQELANGFPDWSKIRQDEQSVGQGLLNVVSKNFETMDTELFRGGANLSLTTANVGEIDLVYRFQLPETFEFEVDNSTQLQPIALSPTVSGRIGTDWYSVSETETGGIKNFWYEAIPDRVDIDGTWSGVNHILLDGNSEGFSYTTIEDPFLSNTLYVEVSGVALLQEAPETEDGFLQAKVRLTGTTWKDTTEAEQIEYIFSEQKKSLKAWKEIDKVQAIDFPASGNIKICSHGFNLNSYRDPFGDLSQYEHSRDNLTTFWNLGDSCWSPGTRLLEARTYNATTALNVLRNRTDTFPVREWELLDSGNNTIYPLDIAPIPFTQRAWAVTQSGLFLYDLGFDQPSQSGLRGRTTSPLAQIGTTRDYVTREEVVEVELLYVRPIRTVIRHRLTVKFPDGISMGILADGTLVSTSTDYWVRNLKEDRLLRSPLDFVMTDLGDHIFTLEAEYHGGDIEVDKRLVRVASKEPLVEFNLYNLIGTTASGVDVDHQQHILVIDDNKDVHRIVPHYDNMLIDFNAKEIIFREDYDEIKVLK